MRAWKYKTISTRIKNAILNKGQKGLYIFGNCILSIIMEEEHYQLRVFGSVLCCLVQLAVKMGKFDVYYEYLKKEIEIKGVDIDFWDNSDAVKLSIKNGPARRDIQDKIEQWLPPLNTKYDIFSSLFCWRNLKRVRVYLMDIRMLYDYNNKELKTIKAVDVYNDTMSPLVKDIHDIWRSEAITSYMRQSLSEIPIAIKYAQKMNLPLGGTFSTGRLESQWDWNKSHTRLVFVHFFLLYFIKPT